MSVCLSITSRHSIEAAEQIELVMGIAAFFHLSYIVLKGNSCISENNSTSLWSFVRNSELNNFRFGISIIEMYYQDSRRPICLGNPHWFCIIMSYRDFQDGGYPPYWSFKIFNSHFKDTFHTLSHQTLWKLGILLQRYRNFPFFLLKCMTT